MLQTYNFKNPWTYQKAGWRKKSANSWNQRATYPANYIRKTKQSSEWKNTQYYSRSLKQKQKNRDKSSPAKNKFNKSANWYSKYKRKTIK